MKLSPIAAFRSISLACFALSFSLAFGQSLRELGGKWVLDLDKMSNVHPEWQGELTPDLWIVTGYSDRALRLWRGVESTEVRKADDVELYDFDGAITLILLGDSEATVEAGWEENRVVARVEPVNGDPAFIRSIYREEQWLVIEDSEDNGGSFRWYFVKT